MVLESHVVALTLVVPIWRASSIVIILVGWCSMLGRGIATDQRYVHLLGLQDCLLVLSSIHILGRALTARVHA